MADENWQQVRKIFDDALRRQPEERARFVNEVCSDDKTLLAEVESLLSSLDSAESFMETPAVAKVAGVIEAETKKLAAGRCFGHYEIIEQIGAGGMGEVYLARDQKLNRRVAVKILNEKFSRHESNLQRFVSEAKAASALNHPNILVIHEIGESGDTHYIVSEFIKGKTLRETFKGKTLKLSEVLDVSIQIAGALSAAHKEHLVHRDIKPENIMIRPDDYVKILDFGLAKLVERENKSVLGLEESNNRQNQTAKGVIMGTVNYMSPEQAKGERVDERTDIFSFGAVIYEMIAGRTPFAGESVLETFANLINQEPQPLVRFASNVPNEMQRMVSKMLRKNKAERFQTMNDVFADLKDLRENLTLEEKLERSASPHGNPTEILRATTCDATLQTAGTQYSFSQRIKQHKVFSTSAVTALLIGAIAIGFYFINRYQSAHNFQAGKTIRLTSSGKIMPPIAISPDGKFIVYVQTENNEQQSLWMRHTGNESNVQIAAPAKIKYNGLNISPDGNSLYYVDALGGSLYRMATFGSTPKKVLNEVIGHKIGFSPDSKEIAFLRQTEQRTTDLVIANADGTNERRLVSFEKPISSYPPILVWSPDGKIIACSFEYTEKLNLIAVRVADGTFASISRPDRFSQGNFVWMPDSKSLLIVGKKEGDTQVSQVWQISYPSGELRRITNDANYYIDINVSSDGRSLAAVRIGQISHIWVMPTDDASRLKQLTDGFEKYDGILNLSWMPDGKIIFNSNASGKSSVWTMKADGNNLRQSVDEINAEAVSPDGRFLVHRKGAVGAASLWQTDLKDASEKQLTKDADSDEDFYTKRDATFSPDGKWVVYSNRGTLWKVAIEGGEPAKILDKGGRFPAVSPDGKMIAFVSFGEQQPWSIALVPFDGGEITNTFDTKTKSMVSNIQNLQWSPDGRAINYIAVNNAVSNIWRQSAGGSPPIQVTEFDSGLIFNFAFSPDGKQLALSRGSVNSDVVLIENSE